MESKCITIECVTALNHGLERYKIIWANLANGPMSILGNYLRARRRQWHLSQKELAFLLGYKNESIVSRLERHERVVTFGTSRACTILFGSGAEDIFPALLSEHDAKLLRRMRELRGSLEQRRPSKSTEAKLQLLQAAISRLAESSLDSPII